VGEVAKDMLLFCAGQNDGTQHKTLYTTKTRAVNSDSGLQNATKRSTGSWIFFMAGLGGGLWELRSMF